MNPPSASEPVPGPAPAPPARIIVPVPPEPGPVTSHLVHAPVPACYRIGHEIVLDHGGTLPLEFCLRCGRTPSLERSFPLRRPGDPRTWFGPRPVLTMALCRRHAEDHSVATALTWSVLSVGGLLLAVGVLTFSPVTLIFGLLAAGCSGWFRATSPASARIVSDRRTILRGAGENYLRIIPGAPAKEAGDETPG